MTERFKKNPVFKWFSKTRQWQAFDFQIQTWQAYLNGQSGLIHAPTGHGKTYAAWLGPLLEYVESSQSSSSQTQPLAPDPLSVLWITPLRALAGDTQKALQKPIDELKIPWTVEVRTGDTASHIKQRQRKKPPSALITTPESLTLLLSYADSSKQLRRVHCVIIDEWHELLSSKRGTQTELALARLRQFNPNIRVWGLSATLGNLNQALDVLTGQPSENTSQTKTARKPVLISGKTIHKTIDVHTICPPKIDRFPWHGHLGLHLLDPVCKQIDQAKTTLVFTNTRSQAELWYAALMQARPAWLGCLAIHHGSLDRPVRDEVERLLAAGRLKAVVCTSSLDLGVDFAPVDQVLQVGSPKGVARLMQRAGRSGHQPGATSRVVGVPAHAFELIEFAAARQAIQTHDVESREPLEKPLDVLAQHMVTCALGGGFDPQKLYNEVKTTYAYRNLTLKEFDWCLDFAVRGGESLTAYPQFARVQSPLNPGDLYTVASKKAAANHRLGIGTITSDAAMTIAFQNGHKLGTVEESFIGKLSAGDCFIFAGQTLEYMRTSGMTAQVRRAKRIKGTVPRWGGGTSPLSTQLAQAVLNLFQHPDSTTSQSHPEMRLVAPLFNLQKRWSILPSDQYLLIEQTTTTTAEAAAATSTSNNQSNRSQKSKRTQVNIRSWFIFAFKGRLVNEGLATLLAYRITQQHQVTLTITHNDYGLQIATPQPLTISEQDWRAYLTPQGLTEDLLACLNASQLARKQFRQIARIAGLLIPTYPGQRKAARHIQASSDLFFDVFTEFDPKNLLLDQAKREVLSNQLEVQRLQKTLEAIEQTPLRMKQPQQLTPLAFPLWAESLREQTLTGQSWQDRLTNMVLELEKQAGADQ